MKNQDRPQEGKVYMLTGGPNDKCLSNGNSWEESAVKTKQSQYEDEILDIIDHADEFTRSDLQGVVSALVMKILNNR